MLSVDLENSVFKGFGGTPLHLLGTGLLTPKFNIYKECSLLKLNLNAFNAFAIKVMESSQQRCNRTQQYGEETETARIRIVIS